MNKIDYKTTIEALIIFSITYIILYNVENSIFWNTVLKYREISGINDSFKVAKEYQVAIKPKILLYHFLFITITYGLGAIHITLKTKSKIYFHILLFVIGIEFVRKVYYFLSDHESFFEFPVLTFSEFIWPIALSILVGFITINLNRITSR